jgi:hypothetical protein
LASAAEAAADRTAPLITTESRWDGAALVAADGLNWTFKTRDFDKHTIAASQVVRWGNFATAIGAHRVRLTSGSELRAHAVEIRGSEISLESELLSMDGNATRAPLRLPRDSVAVAIFDMPTDHDSVRTLEKRITAASVDVDTLLFTNGDQITGQIVDLANDKLNFNSAAADVLVDRARVAAVVFRRAPATKPASDSGLKVWVGLRDGSRLLARNVVVEDASAKLPLFDGGAASVPAETIVALQPIGGDVVYLSDLNHASYRHIPFLSLAWDFLRDHSASGGPLVAQSQRYLKGLGMHSAARITYDLDREYRAFQSEVAIDDSTGALGSVACRVFTDDGSGQWRLKYEGPIIRGGQQPTPVNVDLTDAKRLSLLVDFADRGDEQDHVDWLDARLIR